MGGRGKLWERKKEIGRGKMDSNENGGKPNGRNPKKTMKEKQLTANMLWEEPSNTQ